LTDDLEFEADLEASPETVWRALEEPDLRDAWLAPASVPDDQGGPIDCEVLEADPPHHMRVAWRSRDGALDSEVVFSVSKTDAGSRLKIVHSGLKVANDDAQLKMAA
jgi:uncharacterized protein YndB with AHSA1/START domain